MTVDGIFNIIAEEKPLVVYISGKTSTGKTTFGRKLHDHLGYRVVGLEIILVETAKQHGFDEQTTFKKVFYDDGENEEKTIYLAKTDRLIREAIEQGHPLVIEGAVSNTGTLQRILDPADADLFFVYFHPEDINVYIRNLTARFMESSESSYGGLPRKFWDLIDKKEFEKFCQTRKLTPSLESSIKQYALLSQEQSLTRLEECRQRFNDINVAEIQ